MNQIVVAAAAKHGRHTAFLESRPAHPWLPRTLVAALSIVPTLGAAQIALPPVAQCQGTTCTVQGDHAKPVDIDAIGKDGKKAGSSWPWQAPKNGADGTAGSPREVRVNPGTVVDTNAPGAALRIRTDGGRGGAGEKNIVRHDGMGGNGGQAGRVSVTVNEATLRQRGSIFVRPDALAISARGGAGGGSYDRDHPGRARAGQGGEVSLDLNGVAVSAARGSAVSVDSGGGAGSNGRHLAARGREGGGAGGDAGGQSVRATGEFEASGPAIALRAEGGQGGQVDGGVFPMKGAAGGTGGRGGDIDLGVGNAKTQGATQVTATSTGATGVSALSRGGNGGSVTGTNLVNGADGGAGGVAGKVTLRAEHADIRTQGDEGAGIRAESAGGNGFWGGSSVLFRGGRAGRGGDAGAVTVTVSENVTIDTRGDGAAGILAHSRGGGGHDGGRGGLVGKGGQGARGGAGGEVSLQSEGRIVTQGENAFGVHAASLGGAAGSGGRGIGLIAFGGRGGDASTSSTVRVRTEGAIRTAGAGAHAILAQSVGGDGGAFTGTGTGALGGDKDAFGTGAHGAGVQVDNRATLVTGGQGAHGILAHSVGGGGGNGGAGLGLIAIGGDGASGGNAAAVRVDNTGQITTGGAGASAIAAQSIGGGGGNGGNATAVQGLQHVSFSLGGKGKAAGDGGAVTLAHQGTLATAGADAAAVSLQSIGGGGGNGGSALTLAAQPFALSIGGAGGTAGKGGDVTASSVGTLTTLGAGAAGVLAQSIGGGGGNGGHAVTGGVSLFTLALGGSAATGGDAGKVSLVSQADVATQGDDAAGLLLQSIGGGGGTGGRATALSIAPPTPYGSATASLAIGGGAGVGGHAGAISARNEGRVSTRGQGSRGIVAQSIGGGGGTGGSASANSFSINPETSVAVSVALGRSGGRGGDGNAVDLSHRGQADTAGDLSGALLAQSIGGGGGIGGAAATTAVAYGETSFSGELAIGGAGGAGGDGAKVMVLQHGSVATAGVLARGVTAQSVGGGGGEAGIVDGDVRADTVAASVKLGRRGGNGGNGGAVTVNQSEWARTLTTGFGSDAIFAQSVGGGGGVGSVVGAKAGTDWPDPPKPKGGEKKDKGISGSLAFSLGGAGGQGGNAGSVTAEQAGNVETRGDLANGVLAQSIGGGGGRAGSAKAAASGGDVSASLALGRSGGSGGDGGAVTVRQQGTVTTQGIGASAVIAQSVGGGGGAGSATESGGKGGRLALSVGIGGGGGSGGAAGAVSVANRGTLTSAGGSALIAQSVGGGGGIAGVVTGESQVKSLADDDKKEDTSRKIAASVTLGGSGGSGGKGGSVAAENDGRISAGGAGGSAAIVQSIGGGGGMADLASASAKAGDVALSLALAGNGGKAGDAGAVSFANRGQMQSTGERGIGVLAQSIGGGGGAGGAAHVSDDAKLAIGSAIGGTGGAAGHGSRITLFNSGTLVTEGAQATGVLAQSVGGGGGMGGATLTGSATSVEGVQLKVPLAVTIGGGGGAGGNGGAVSWVQIQDSAVATRGDDAAGVVLQSIGGGGGSAALLDERQAPLSDGVAAILPSRLTLAIGGHGGSAGDGGEVSALNDGPATRIQTAGERAVGLLAQSVGGGGGIASLSNRRVRWHDGTLDVGGAAGAAGAGGKVDISHTGTVATQGRQAHAVWAQSIGGGGGIANLAGTVQDGLSLNARGGGQGNGGPVSVSVQTQHQVSTAGDGAVGILAQSIGGGGGYVGDSDLLRASAGTQSLAGASARGGDGRGGAVQIDVDGTVHTNGRQATAVFAQSVGGGGGILGAAAGAAANGGAGDAGPVTIGVNGSVKADGDGAAALFAQSVAAKGKAGTIHIGLGEGAQVQGGSGSAAAAVISGGAGNRLDLAAGSRLWSRSGQAVEASGAALAVRNAGLLQGSLMLDAGAANSMHNLPGGVFEPGATVRLGRGNTLLNEGTLAPGGNADYVATHLQGSYRQSSTGEYVAKVDFASGVNDQLIVSEAADLDGKLRIAGLNHRPGATATVVAAGESLTVRPGFASVSTPVYAYPVEMIEDRALRVGIEADFDAERLGLSTDQTALGGYLDRRWSQGLATAGQGGTPNAGDSGISPVYDLLAQAGDSAEYQHLLDRLAHDSLQAPAASLPVSARLFAGRMMRCPASGEAQADWREQDCFWGRVDGRRLDRSDSHDDTGFETDTVTTQFGGQRRLRNGWLMGGSVAYENARTKTDGALMRTRGDAFMGGVMLRREAGAWLYTGALSAGYGKYRSTRDLLPGVQPRSDWRSHFAALSGQVAYTHVMGNVYLQPRADVDLLHVRVPGYGEREGGALGLQMQGQRQTSVAITPTIELGGRFEAGGATVQPYVSIGASWLSNTSWDITARFQGDGGGDSFTLSQRMPRAYLDLNAGVSLLQRNGVELKAAVRQRSANHFRERAGELRLGVRF